MSGLSPNEVTGATIVRYDVAKIRVGQAVVPVAIVAGVVFRHFPGIVSGALAIAAQLVALLIFARARRGLGRQVVRVERGKVKLGELVLEIVPAHVARWTMDGRTARLYAGQVSWKLTAVGDNGDALRVVLSRVLGKPIALSRRGSPRARLMALIVGLVGLAMIALAIAYQLNMAFVFIGVPAVIMGFATFATLTQKAAMSCESADLERRDEGR
jgi:hypothetical protein